MNQQGDEVCSSRGKKRRLPSAIDESRNKRFVVISAELDSKLAERDDGYFEMGCKLRRLENMVDSQAITIMRQSQEINRLMDVCERGETERKQQTVQIERMKQRYQTIRIRVNEHSRRLQALANETLSVCKILDELQDEDKDKDDNIAL